MKCYSDTLAPPTFRRFLLPVDSLAPVSVVVAAVAGVAGSVVVVVEGAPGTVGVAPGASFPTRRCLVIMIFLLGWLLRTCRII
jgi:hypothetical protein